MPEIILHEKVRLALENQVKKSSQAILLSGEQGIGKTFAAFWLAAKLLNVKLEKTASSPHIMHIKSSGKNISVDSIRELNNFLKLKSTNQNTVQRIVIIENAELMTMEAQNALLKNLEEPPAGTVFVLTSSNERVLLPTIRSRLQVIKVLPPAKMQLEEFFTLPEPNFSQLYNLSGGLPGLFKALSEQADHPLVKSINQARQFLAATSFEKLKLASEFSGQKTEALDLAKALKRLSNAAILNAADQSDDKKVQRWQNVLQAALRAEESLEKESNLKLTLTNLALSL